MTQSFRMTRTQVVDADAASLKATILAETGSESGAESIMRSLERMGADASIEYFEMTQVAASRKYGATAPAAWRVRADRGIVAEEESQS